MPVDLSKGHPLFEKAEIAKVSIRKANLEGQPVAVYLVADFSFSMTNYYADGTMQDLTDRMLALSAGVDDDGSIPVILFHNRSLPEVRVHVDQSVGAMDRIVAQAGGMGGTAYAPAIAAVRELHRREGQGNPGLVVFQTDGDTGNPGAVEKQIKDAAREPLFFQFVGYGYEEKAFLDKLDKMPGRVIDNAGYFHAGPNPKGTPDAELYDRIIGGEFTQEWMPAFKQQFGGFSAAPRRRGLFGGRR
jgi:hypothetical protein